jgi:hypothetical protein
MPSSPHDPYELGHPHATMAMTMGIKVVRQSESVRYCSSSNCSMQLGNKELKLTVVRVNFP